jgi:nicotinate-nucleotide adenylyltransferase
LTIHRLGIYGGTFDPIHSGHVEVAREIRTRFGLDLMLIVPAACPPHKKQVPISSAYHRYALAVLATIGIPEILVSTVEIEQPDRPYTYQTLERLAALYENAALYFVLGSDSFEELHSWKEPLRILSRANLIVAARPGYEMENNRLLRMLKEGNLSFQAAGAPDAADIVIEDLRGRPDALTDLNDAGTGRIFLTDFTWRDVSSTEIRRRARQGAPIDELVPQSVADYIEKYQVYRNRIENGEHS